MSVPDAPKDGGGSGDITSVCWPCDTADATRWTPCSCVAGMTTDEAGEALGVTGRTVKRQWQKARMLLYAFLRTDRQPP